MPGEKLKVITSYVVATIILSFYGGQVCPFIEQLSLVQVSIILACAFAAGFFLREIIFKYAYKKLDASSVDQAYQAIWRYLFIDLGVWGVIGFFITFVNMIFYAFPLVSGLKVVLGCLTLGFFSATYFSLAYEREVIVSGGQRPGSIIDAPGKFFSISSKFLLFLGISYSVMGAIILLLIFKDLSYISENLMSPMSFVFRAVTIEVLFVFAIIFGGGLFIAKQYGRNLKLMFHLQLKALNDVREGNYDTSVPVVSNDEFALIAKHSNRMIHELKEKERIRNIFGKYLSPSIAKSVLESEQGTQLGGRQVDVAILFADMRNYTSLSEKLHPGETVNLLNAYFALLVKAIYASGGIVDKFIGDAVMAVYGLDDLENPCEAAVTSAFNMVEQMEPLNQDLRARGMSVGIGIGIHFGPVIAGNIGAKERIEYTVIGDTVNTASRLESLSKTVSSRIVVSKDTFIRLPAQLQSSIADLGEFELKGKSEKIRVYGPV